jgi:hypothetical protein
MPSLLFFFRFPAFIFSRLLADGPSSMRN